MRLHVISSTTWNQLLTSAMLLTVVVVVVSGVVRRLLNCCPFTVTFLFKFEAFAVLKVVGNDKEEEDDDDEEISRCLRFAWRV